MFKLLRYFSIASLISIVIASVLLGVLYRELAIRNLIEMGEDHNVDMTRAFANTLWPMVEPVVQASNRLSGEELRAMPEIRRLHDAIYAEARGLSVAKIKVYNLSGLTSYSSEERQIGEDASRNEGVRRALKGGVASELVYRDTFSAFEQTIERTNLISTYMPIRAPGSERIEAVFELYDNVTPQVARIRQTQVVVIAGLLVVFSLLYGVLFLIVRRADGILRRQEDERRQNEEKLRESGAALTRTQFAVDNAADMVFWTDQRGGFTYANQSSCRRLGYSRAEMLGMSVWDIDPNYPQEAWPAVWQRLQREGQLRIETSHRARDGEIFPAEVNVKHVSYEGEEFACAFGRDISERRRAESELVAAKDAAEAASRAKAQFLTNMGHELRTPLNAVLGMTDLTLMEGSLSREVRDNLQTVRAAANDLLNIISGVLDFSEIEAGNLTLAAEPFSPREALEGEVRAAAMRAREKGLELGHSVTAEVPEVVIGDGGRLRQVLRNLLDNAIKFTDAGSVTVVATTLPAAAGETELYFTVADTGPGISEAQQALVFEAFVQADGSPTRKHGGTGLGLTICAHLVQLMHGRIWVESAAGRGSKFHFTVRLPVAGSGRAG